MWLFVSFLVCLAEMSVAVPKEELRELELSVVSFNVENLFDESHDTGKDDWAFLPLSAKKNARHHEGCLRKRSLKYRRQCLELDWNREAIEKKIELMLTL